MIELERIGVAWVQCDYCGAVPGDPCVTSSGRRAVRPHTGRWAAVWHGWQEGWADGKGEGLAAAQIEVRILAERLARLGIPTEHEVDTLVAQTVQSLRRRLRTS